MSDLSNYLTSMQNRIHHQREELEKLHQAKVRIGDELIKATENNITLTAENCALLIKLNDLEKEVARLKAEQYDLLDRFVEKARGYYDNLRGHTFACLVAYHLKVVAEEFKEKETQEDNNGQT
jgi:hemerythrin-like domain-containing protein